MSLEKAYQEALEAERSSMPPLGLAPFLPLVEAGLAEAFDDLDDKERVDRVYKFREALAPAQADKDLRSYISRCRLCPRLRRPVVVGEGKYHNPRVSFYAEAPGDEENKKGRPLIGPAGQVFRRALTDSGLNEADVWISNVARCLPPGEGNQSFGKPTKQEVENCRKYMIAEIEICAPKLVVLLGNYPLQAIFPKQTITKVRGEVRRVGAVMFLATWHPSFVLRDRRHEQEFKDDIAKAARLTA